MPTTLAKKTSTPAAISRYKKHIPKIDPKDEKYCLVADYINEVAKRDAPALTHSDIAYRTQCITDLLVDPRSHMYCKVLVKLRTKSNGYAIPALSMQFFRGPIAKEIVNYKKQKDRIVPQVISKATPAPAMKQVVLPKVTLASIGNIAPVPALAPAIPVTNKTDFDVIKYQERVGMLNVDDKYAFLHLMKNFSITQSWLETKVNEKGFHIQETHDEYLNRQPAIRGAQAKIILLENPVLTAGLINIKFGNDWCDMYKKLEFTNGTEEKRKLLISLVSDSPSVQAFDLDAINSMDFVELQILMKSLKVSKVFHTENAEGVIALFAKENRD
jgi:hypothetical protein